MCYFDCQAGRLFHTTAKQIIVLSLYLCYIFYGFNTCGT